MMLYFKRQKNLEKYVQIMNMHKNKSLSEYSDKYLQKEALEVA